MATQNENSERGGVVLHELVRAKRGMKVEVFNQVGDNFNAIIVALNKRTARVRACEKWVPFTNHPEARTEAEEGEEYLVPYRDLKPLGPNEKLNHI